jgi:hypothetical protein
MYARAYTLQIRASVTERHHRHADQAQPRAELNAAHSGDAPFSIYQSSSLPRSVDIAKPRGRLCPAAPSDIKTDGESE